MQKIKPFLWFDKQAEEAANFYVSIFKNSKITNVSRYPDEGPGQPGAVMTVSFELDGEEFIALNGGPQFTFTEAISLFVTCKTQAEVDDYWQKLTADGGAEVQCGWLRDKYGLFWQIVPEELMDLIGGADEEKANRAFQAMLGMKKIDVNAIRKAADAA